MGHQKQEVTTVPVDQLIDYAKQGKKNKPRMLHRTARTPGDPTTPFRPATPQELASLRTCFHCQQKEDQGR
jgi:hypothetical protein